MSQDVMYLVAYMKAIVGALGLCYFFVTEHENWGEAIGLTLFYSSDILRSTVRPPFLHKMLSRDTNVESYQNTWRIVLGVLCFACYVYFELYLNIGLSIYMSTICLSLFWESQVADEALDFFSRWVCGHVFPNIFTVVVFIAEGAGKLSLATQTLIRNVIQEFLRTIYKLYKHFENIISVLTQLNMTMNRQQIVSEYIVDSCCTSPFLSKRDADFIAMSSAIPELKEISDITVKHQKRCGKVSSVRQHFGWFPCVF